MKTLEFVYIKEQRLNILVVYSSRQKLHVVTLYGIPNWNWNVLSADPLLVNYIHELCNDIQCLLKTEVST